ncbi:MAG TPA: replication initiator [Streptosporangiaceae bacterium]|nr:replication initiator [Streptosporangiaceae bacterium]
MTTTRHRFRSTREAALHRGGDGYFTWLDHIWPAAGCTHPIRLHGRLRVVDTRTGELLRSLHTADMPDHVIYKACGNRRHTACPSCAETYRRDAYHVIRAGLIGGKGIPETVTTHPAVFATFTAPSFGPVHTRAITRHTCADRARCTCRPDPCRARRDAATCEHGIPIVCFARHDPADPRLGQPICHDCYDYACHVVWNNAAGELWRRTKQHIERHLAQLARHRGVPPVWVQDSKGRFRAVSPLRVSHGKAAEFQARGAVHFHVLLRLDGFDPDDPGAIVPPPREITASDLDDAIHHAADAITFTTLPHPIQPDGWPIEWGAQVDVRIVTMRGDNPVTDAMVAGYLAKYSTKSTEATGHTSARLTTETVTQHASPQGNHTQRLIHACWTLGEADGLMFGKTHGWNSLRLWAHMLGFGGHFLTKARRYSVTFGALRAARIYYQRHQTTGPEHDTTRITSHGQDDTILVLGDLRYAGTGWKTTGDALLANTAADLARRRRQAGHEELAHEQGLNANAERQAA